MVSHVLKLHSVCHFCVGMYFIFDHDKIWPYENYIGRCTFVDFRCDKYNLCLLKKHLIHLI